MRHILSLDVETNGLHGSVFAIGAILLQCNSDYSNPQTIKTFDEVCEPPAELDDWVVANVMPKLRKKRVKPEWEWQNPLRLERKFVKFYKEVQKLNPEVVAFCPMPCETNFFRTLQSQYLIDELAHPCPFYDLATLFHYEGCKDPASMEANYEAITCKKYDNKQAHDPLYDAQCQLDCYVSLMQTHNRAWH